MKGFLTFYLESFHYFGDRCGKTYYFLAVSIWMVTFIVTMFLQPILPKTLATLLFYLQLFIFTLPAASAVSKRLHDIGFPGILGILLIPLIFIFSPLFVLGLIVIGLVPGKTGANKYGDDPRNLNTA